MKVMGLTDNTPLYINVLGNTFLRDATIVSSLNMRWAGARRSQVVAQNTIKSPRTSRRFGPDISDAPLYWQHSRDWPPLGAVWRRPAPCPCPPPPA